MFKLVQFYFSLSVYYASVKRIFLLMKSQWIDERNRLKLTSVKSILMIKYNGKDIVYVEFHNYLMNMNDLLKIHSMISMIPTQNFERYSFL